MSNYVLGENFAARVQAAVARVEGMSLDSEPTKIPTRFDELSAKQAKVFRVATSKGEWPVNTQRTVTLRSVASAPNTVSVLNELVSLPAPKSTHTSRIVNIAKDGTQWYLVSFQMATATAVFAGSTQSITYINGASTATLEYVGSMSTQETTLVSAGQRVSVLTSLSASLNTNDCSIAITPFTTSVQAVGATQKATTVLSFTRATATILMSGTTQTASVFATTHTATYITLEI